MKILNLANELNIPFENIALIGSTLICGKGNDEDYIALIPYELDLFEYGFRQDLEAVYTSEFCSWRREDINLIATNNHGFFLSEIAIANGAKLINNDSYDMTKRDERIRFHAEVRKTVANHLQASVTP